MREARLFARLLKKRGYSLTAARKDMFRLLKNGRARTINEIDTALPYDLSTIYRTLQLFQKLGVVVELHAGTKHKFELSDIFQHHHHHITCVKCGRVITLPNDRALELGIARLSRQCSFKPLDHQLEIRGLCAQHSKT